MFALMLVCALVVTYVYVYVRCEYTVELSDVYNCQEGLHTEAG